MDLSRALSLCALAIVMFLASCNAQQHSQLGAVASAGVPSPGEAAHSEPQAAHAAGLTEHEWIARDVTTAIRQMVMSGAAGIQAPEKDHTTVVEPWAPARFAPLASGLTGPSTCAAPRQSAAVRALLNPRPNVLIKENERISVRLQRDMKCADAQYEAALLLGTLALRETAGRFTDPRRIISRMTAHLAVADAIDADGASTVKGLAHATLLTLAGRQRDALNALAKLSSDQPDVEVKAWTRALRLRNTLDWREAENAKGMTLLEQLSLLRALDVSLGTARSLERFDAIEEPADVADWPRLLLHWSPGVWAGNRFTQHWIAAELAEFGDVLETMGTPPAATKDGIIEAMNLEAGDGPVGADGVVRVIDGGLWAAAAQRHLMMALVSRHQHLVGALGLKEDARTFRDDASRSFSNLRLYPLAAIGMAQSRDEIATILPRAATLVRTRPDLITDHVSRTLTERAQFATLTRPGNPASWFRPLVVPGTAFDVESRVQPDGKEPRLTKAEIADLRQRAPFSRRLAIEAVRWSGGPTYETLQREYADLAPFDLEFAADIAKAAWDRPEIYVPLMERVCAMNADEGYWDLAPYLVDHGRVDEGRRAYERWLSVGRSPVSISNSMSWLVRHYHERGEHSKAEAVADQVAETGSFWGLVTRANLHDWRGQFDEAEQLHRRAWKRYDHATELLAFYLRNGRKGREVEELLHEIFPVGMTQFAPGASTAPRDGVLVKTTGVVGKEEGVKLKDVIVAVDGIRVRNDAQYRAAWGASREAVVKLTVWRGGKYVDLSSRLRHRWIVSWVETYRPDA